MTEERSGRPAVDHIDLRRLNPDAVDAVRRCTAERGFSVFRDQHLRPHELERFVGSLGPLVFTPGEQPMPGHRYVFEVTNRNRPAPPRSVYHSDTSYVAEPPAFTVLAATEVPDRGDTLVVDLYASYRCARQSLIRELEGVELLHIPTMVDDPDGAGDGHWHPVIRSHPVTGRLALYLCARERLAAARRNGVELSGPHAERLIDRVHRHATGAVQPHRHQWGAGDVLLIDNRCTLHAADHSMVEGPRTLYRVMCLGS